MIEKVKADPTLPVGEAIREIKLKIAREFGNNKDEFTSVMDGIGSHHALEQRLTEARIAIIGQTPRSRNDFDVMSFKEKGYLSTDVIILDSDNLPDNWESMLNSNMETAYDWDKFNEAMLSYEEGPDNDDAEKEEDFEVSENEPNGKEKRVLAYTSMPLLVLLSECRRGSLDGTFKSCSKLWKPKYFYIK